MVLARRAARAGPSRLFIHRDGSDCRRKHSASAGGGTRGSVVPNHGSRHVSGRNREEHARRFATRTFRGALAGRTPWGSPRNCDPRLTFSIITVAPPCPGSGVWPQRPTEHPMAIRHRVRFGYCLTRYADGAPGQRSCLSPDRFRRRGCGPPTGRRRDHGPGVLPISLTGLPSID